MWIQLTAAALFNGYAAGFAGGGLYTGPLKAVCVPVLNCYSCPGALGSCPIGAIQALVGGPGHRFPFYVLGTVMLFGVLLGRAVCGFLCPFGFVQDLLHRLPVKKWRVPDGVDRPLRFLKYGVLLVTVVLLPLLATNALGVAPPFFCKYLCPAGTLQGGIPQLLMSADLRRLAGWLFDWKLGILVAVLLLSAKLGRPFCRYLCPLGALYALFNRFSLVQMRLDSHKCVGCRACERACPMQVRVTKDINSPECVRCGRCRSACPHGAIAAEFTLRNREQVRDS